MECELKKETAQDVFQWLKDKGASYSDIRTGQKETEHLKVRNGENEAIEYALNRALGIRVLYNGSWGFASSSSNADTDLLALSERAFANAAASSRINRKPIVLSKEEVGQGIYESAFKIDPFTVKTETKLSFLQEVEASLHIDERIKVGEASMYACREGKIFASSEGAWIEQNIITTGAEVSVTAAAGQEVQRRSFPSSFGGNQAQKGYEFVNDLELDVHAEGIVSEALSLLSAERCPSGKRDIIVDSSQMAVQIHESCGHPTELDRALGMEISLAGGSFLTPEKLNNFQYGSQEVNIVADATIPGGVGSVFFDDEGVRGQRTVLVDNGVFCNYLTSRETAASLGQKSNGSMRIEDAGHLPIIRMTNISLEPGDWSLEELIKDTKDGILMSTNKSWSIDDLRLNFRFSTEIAWEIKDGSIGKILKNPGYSGITPEFWQNCTGVADKKEWKLWGIPNCGKGEPVQTVAVGHGSSPARFTKVQVEGR